MAEQDPRSRVLVIEHFWIYQLFRPRELRSRIGRAGRIIQTTMRSLGSTPLQVSSLCLGGNVFGWTADERASFEVLDAYVGGGGNFIDTADAYSAWVSGHSGGESEAILGRWLAMRKN